MGRCCTLHDITNPIKFIYYLLNGCKNEERKTLILSSIQYIQKHINQDISVSMIRLNTDNPAKFKNFGFTSILDDIIRDRQNDEFFINITSGTTQMIAAMCLEVVTNNRDFRTIQVLNPNPNRSQELKYNEFEYQFDNNLITSRKSRVERYFLFKIAKTNTSKILRYDYDGALETANSRYFKETDIKALVEFAYYCDKLRKKCK